MNIAEKPGSDRHHRRVYWNCWLLIALLASGIAAADYPLEIIELTSRLPEDVIPIVAPLARPDGTVVGSGGALFVRAAPAQLADIRRALTEIDRPAQNLLIQVRQAGSRRRTTTGVGARIDERLGDSRNSTRVRIGAPGPGGSGVRAWAGEQQQAQDVLQQVRALDGHPARITVGTDRPQPYRETVRGPGYRATRDGATYYRTETGFSVVPRVLGDRVTLEIGATASDPGAGHVVRSAGVSTRVEGRLGEWIPIGASTDSADTRGAGVLHAGRGSTTRDHQIELRVLTAP